MGATQNVPFLLRHLLCSKIFYEMWNLCLWPTFSVLLSVDKTKLNEYKRRLTALCHQPHCKNNIHNCTAVGNLLTSNCLIFFRFILCHQPLLDPWILTFLRFILSSAYSILLYSIIRIWILASLFILKGNKDIKTVLHVVHK